MRSFAKSIGQDVGDRAFARQEKLRSQGRIQNANKDADVFASGVQVMAPLTQQGQRLSAGSYFTWGGQEVRTMDGSYRLIDSQVMNEEINTVVANENAILDLVELFLKSGSDQLAQKYLGGFFNLLAKGQKADVIKECLKAQNVPDADTVGAELAKIEARPSFLRYKSELSNEFGDGVKKLKAVISFAALVFDNRQIKRDPEGMKGAPKDVDKGEVDGTGKVDINALANA